MGPLGWQETIFIFILALLIFGPRKLPELGRTLGKAITEFRRASNELKATWDRELRAIEEETRAIEEETRKVETEIASSYYSSAGYYDYEYDQYEESYYSSYSTSDSGTTSQSSSPLPESDESPKTAPADEPDSADTEESTALAASEPVPGVPEQETVQQASPEADVDRRPA